MLSSWRAEDRGQHHTGRDHNFCFIIRKLCQIRHPTMDPVHCIVASSSPHEGWDVVWIYRLEMKKWLSCNNRQSNSMQNPESNKGNVNYNRHNQLKLKSKCNGYFDKMSAQERKRRCQIPTIGVISCTERSQYTAPLYRDEWTKQMRPATPRGG